MRDNFVYFVWTKPATSAPFRVARREVKTRTSKGYPISYILICVPRGYESWERAQRAADRLNHKLRRGQPRDWPEEEEQEIE
jgi:hypothetical protein